MKHIKFKIETCSLLLGFLCFTFFVQIAHAQSTDQNFPTAITANEISGRIPARDIGDARETGYYYVFNAVQGDVFINVVTANFNGDIDVFAADNLRPLTKITVYADNADSETGRVIYLRQPTKLILRIEGRTPNDDAATYRIKFAGSFAPAQINTAENSELPTVKSDNQTDVRVNSVGTIIEIKPKPTPQPKEAVAEIKASKEAETKEQQAETKEQQAKTEAGKVAAETKKAKKQKESREKELIAEKETPTVTRIETEPVVVAIEDVPVKDQAETEAPVAEKQDSPAEIEGKINELATDEVPVKEETVKTEPKKVEKSKSVKSLPAAALENIRLIVLFKDGSKIERSMSEITKVGVDKGVLTITSKDGATGRYSILDVDKMTIE